MSTAERVAVQAEDADAPKEALRHEKPLELVACEINHEGAHAVLLWLLHLPHPQRI